MIIILIIVPFFIIIWFIYFDSVQKNKQVNSEPEDNEFIIIDHMVKAQYGPTAIWTFGNDEDAIKISRLEKGSYPILVQQNGIISYTKVGIDVDSNEPKIIEPAGSEKPDEKETEKLKQQENVEDEKLNEDFNPLEWFQKPEIRDAVRLLKTSNHSEFLIPEDYLPAKKYWPKIKQERLILGFKSVKIADDGINVLIDD